MTAQYLETFEEFPSSQAGASFGVDQILQKVKASFASHNK
jgi:hypothetical protein